MSLPIFSNALRGYSQQLRHPLQTQLTHHAGRKYSSSSQTGRSYHIFSGLLLTGIFTTNIVGLLVLEKQAEKLNSTIKRLDSLGGKHDSLAGSIDSLAKQIDKINKQLEERHKQHKQDQYSDDESIVRQIIKENA